MNTLQNKRILLGVTGGIAAYKSVELVRRLRDRGCEVRVVMTAGAQEFIRPLTFQAVSGQPVRTSLFDTEAEGAMGHIELARWADAILIAPCSAHTLARLAQGLAEDLLSTLCLAADCPLAIAPAMNRLMWAKTATQDNLKLLQDRGVHVFGPDSGAQACGDIGEGRMFEVEALVSATAALFRPLILTGRRILITAGPTRESIDPVRFLSNYKQLQLGQDGIRAGKRGGGSRRRRNPDQRTGHAARAGRSKAYRGGVRAGDAGRGDAPGANHRYLHRLRGGGRLSPGRTACF
jgi:phosphopantothenoylcysteine decarboxylase / phosphopantothenate---cysteine ligase